MVETVVYGGLEWELFAQRERELTRSERIAVFFSDDSKLPEKREMTVERHHRRLAELPAINKLPGNLNWRAPYIWEVNRLHIDGLRKRLNPQQMRLWHDMFSHGVGEWYDLGISRERDVLTLHYSSHLDDLSPVRYRASMPLHLEDCFPSHDSSYSHPISKATPLFTKLLYDRLPEQLPSAIRQEQIIIPYVRKSICPAGRKDGYCIAVDERFASRGVRELKSYSGR
ncbi:hypothetical protein HZC31_03905 [Candidatus Woesearchaeota archaeon]|nr:hypothetical protein [Candidatus Woesearchaeota archaeon]